MTPDLQSLLDAFHELKPNSRKHAEFFLTTGRLHSECHYVIASRLADFVRRVETGGPRVRAEVLGALGLRLPAEEIKEFPAELEGAAA
jgi:hypothetical protein